MRLLSAKECSLTGGAYYHDPFNELNYQFLYASLSSEQRRELLEKELFIYGTALGALIGGMSGQGLISYLTLCPFLMGSGAVIGVAGGGYAAYSGINYLFAK